MQTHFVFFDTETHIKGNLINGTQTLKLGWAKYWNQKTDETKWFYFQTPNSFWNWIEKLNIKDLIIFAHNADFDMKQVDAYKQLLIKRKYTHKSTYVKGMVYIFEVTKQITNKEGKNEKRKIRIWDSCNYLPYTLKAIGESIGIPKMKMPDFQDVDKQYLKEYCKNDVEVLAQFIKQLINFLKIHNLTRLKSTGSSIAMNAFRHKFYNEKTNPIYIHAHPQATRLERASFRGGITDLYQPPGQYKRHAYKLDINSMYPNACLHQMPVELIDYKQYKPNLKEKMLQNLDKYHCIAECEFKLSLKYSLILNKIPIKFDKNNQPKQYTKCIFVKGTQTAALNTPEIKYILEHGEILKVNKLAMYRKADIFTEYVKFFYQKKVEYKKTNPAFCEFSKLCLNKLYGKWGQKASDYNLISKTMPFDVNSKIIYTPHQDDIHLMHFGNKLYKITKTDDNAVDSFVAISSAIAAYSRIHLIELILKAGIKHVYYSDTDSLIVDETGYERLQNEIDQLEIGKLKIEEETNNFEIIKPKHYIFNGNLKVKGVKKNATILLDNDLELCVIQNSFERFNGMMRKGNFDTQITTMTVKNISKNYDKGKIRDGYLDRFTVKELQAGYHLITQKNQVSGGGETFFPSPITTPEGEIIFRKQQQNLETYIRELPKTNHQTEEDLFDKHAYHDKTLNNAENREIIHKYQLQYIKS